MIYLFVFLLLVFSIFIHELGHAILMYKYGVGIKEFGLGFRTPKCRKYLKFNLKRFPGIDFTINPIFLGAYVKPSEQGEQVFNAMAYREKAHICGAGPLANLILFMVILLIGATMNNKFFPVGLYALSAIAISVIFSGFLTRYILPLLGLATLCLISYIIFSLDLKAVAGPVGIVGYASKIDTVRNFLLFGLDINLSLALFNLIPLFPLDGGHIFGALLKKRSRIWEEKFQALSVFFFLLIIAFFLISDFIKIII